MGFGGLLGVVAHTHLEGCLNCVAKGFLWVAVVEVDEVSVATSSGIRSLAGLWVQLARSWCYSRFYAGLWVQLARSWCYSRFYAGFATLLPTHVGSNLWDLVDYSES
ncbi:hypothetical protein BCR33DRAFT_716041 [Rhizoclosmatium globosum]|uniref:Uncharacterized protein n=1 Tax=Rhizoclosmatium globosum TaxID=329046 RepID=A0A1Y2CG58_9FUNG|nr:hypothetical protein BCR33DRAFT_716041 [Rhizoclosmatium globosum]|eukprot:ORY46030.1 hypothetical protein BCR33DRAFT_716041 [Rhizoclosmatium globosum]